MEQVLTAALVQGEGENLSTSTPPCTKIRKNIQSLNTTRIKILKTFTENVKEGALWNSGSQMKKQSLCNTVGHQKNKTQLGNEVSSLLNCSIPQLAFAGQPEFFI